MKTKTARIPSLNRLPGPPTDAFSNRQLQRLGDCIQEQIRTQSEIPNSGLFEDGNIGPASFQRARKSWHAHFALAVSLASA